MRSLYYFGARNARQQDRLGGLRHTQFGETGSIAQQHQVALVGVQGMRTRMRRQHCGVGKIGLSQRGVRRRFQRKISKAVVDQINRRFAMPKRARAQLKF